MLWTIGAAAGEARNRIRYTGPVADHVRMDLGLADGGLGLAALPKLSIPATHPTVQRIPLVEPTIHRVLGLIPRKDRPLQPAAATLSRMLRDSLADGLLNRP